MNEKQHLENILAILSDDDYDEVIAHRIYTYVTYYELLALLNKEEINRNEKLYINSLPNKDFPKKQ